MLSTINEFVATVLFTVLGYQVTLLEFVAVLASLIGVWLGTTGKQIMWPWWGLSSALYGWLFLNYALYASAALQLVFIAAAIWGWFGWGPKGATSKNLSWLQRALIIALGAVTWLVITPLLISIGAAAAMPECESWPDPPIVSRWLEPAAERVWSLQRDGDCVDAELQGQGEYGWMCRFVFNARFLFGRRWLLRSEALACLEAEHAERLSDGWTVRD